MFLKRIEIQGFKSFPDRTVIDFVPGVTAVVGPNGSGKSNIIDAIRWVLGEQSAKSLRGAKMEDIIFSGSETRRRSNRAEVKLVLDNSSGLFPLQFTEIEVARSLYRSGDSEYSLNGETCRLKDIQDAFLDSGLGKSGFSIISQGRVDEILNSPPEKRRLIFDEAAGVLKYKTRKLDAEKKLENTEEHLDRVLDILTELDSRVGPLEEQATRAKKAKVLDDHIRTKDRELLTYEALQLHQVLEELRKKEAVWKEAHAEKLHALATLEREVQEMEKKKETLEQERTALYDRHVEAKTKLERWEGQKLVRIEKKQRFEEEMSRIEEQLRSVQALHDEHLEKVKEKEAVVKELRTQHAAIAAEMDVLRASIHESVEEVEARLEKEQVVYIEALNEEANIRHRMEVLKEQSARDRALSEETSGEGQSLKEAYERAKQEWEEAKKHVATLRQQLEEVEKTTEQIKEEADQKKAQFDRQQTIYRQAQQQMYELEQRQTVLARLQEEMTGFYSGVKNVLQASNLTGIEGAIAQLLHIPSEYMDAFDTALGNALQHIVTLTTSDAKRAIHHLKNSRGGRATFLPLDTIRPRVIPGLIVQRLSETPGFVGVAADLAQYDAKYDHVVRNLLGATIVAENLDDATNIAQMIHHKFRVVTLEGDVIYAGGSLSGGQKRNRSTVFSQKVEYEEVTKQLDHYKRSFAQAEGKMARTKEEANRAYEQYLQRQTLVAKAKQEVDDQEKVFQQKDWDYRSVEARWKAFEMQHAQRALTMEQSNETLKELATKHEKTLEKVDKTKQTIAALELRIQDGRKEEKVMEQQHQALRERQVTINEQLRYEEELLVAEKEALQREATRSNELKEERRLLEKEEGLTHSEEEIAQAIHHWQGRITTQEHRMEEITQQLAQLTEVLQKESVRLKEEKELHEKERNVYQRLEIERSKRETTFQHTMQQLKAKYGTEQLEEPAKDFDEQKVREQLHELRGERKLLGEVNPLAIEEYEEVKERHQFLTEQRNDLLEAKGTLLEAMDEMDEEMTERFDVTFRAIRHQFQIVFQQMFGGGEADLILTNPDDLLTTGVDIIARPPGKKLQNLRLLSGGERALTAITLLFAMIDVRPVPFCILDEVEAALDEANVTRYSNYLKTYAKDIQFIVITHRKGTMEGADVLYGVTMQESGVSTLLSVQLSEVEEQLK